MSKFRFQKCWLFAVATLSIFFAVGSGGGDEIAKPAVPATRVLLYKGAGANESDAQALAEILRSRDLNLREVDSATLNEMSLAELERFSAIVWPGGEAEEASASLTASTRSRIRQAVMSSGVGFSGFGAGAWLAVGASAEAWGLALIPGKSPEEYVPNGQYLTTAMVPISYPNGTERSMLWWQGPALPSLPGAVVAKYPNGKAAMIQAWAGKGWVTLTGVHPEAPQSWRSGLVDSDGLDMDYAWTLIQSAIKKSPMAAW